MKHENFNFKQHGFVGHLAEPDAGSDRAVIVIMGGEQSLLPGIKFAERFADYGIMGLAVSLFGADGIPDAPNQIPLDMFLPAVSYLRSKKHILPHGTSNGNGSCSAACLPLCRIRSALTTLKRALRERSPYDNSRIWTGP